MHATSVFMCGSIQAFKGSKAERCSLEVGVVLLIRWQLRVQPPRGALGARRRLPSSICKGATHGHSSTCSLLTLAKLRRHRVSAAAPEHSVLYTCTRGVPMQRPSEIPTATQCTTCCGMGCCGFALRRCGLRKDSVPRRLQLVGEAKLQVQQVQCLVLQADGAVHSSNIDHGYATAAPETDTARTAGPAFASSVRQALGS